MKAAIRIREIEVTDALVGLGLSLPLLHEVMQCGEIARDACTANDPPSAPGFASWAAVVRALRETLALQGWERNDDGNFSTVVSPDGRLAIAVATGDEGTGKPLLTPKTKYPKGSTTAVAVERNRAQLNLFELNPPEPSKLGNAPDRQTWVLMRRRNGDSLFAELSLPAGVGNDGRIEEWSSRIILEPIKISAPTVSRYSEGEPIDVPVHRRK